MNYFKINHGFFTAAVLGRHLYNPTSLIILSIIGAAWTYVYLVRMELLKIGDRPISEREKLLAAVQSVAVFFCVGRDHLPGAMLAVEKWRALRREGAGRPVHRR